MRLRSSQSFKKNRNIRELEDKKICECIGLIWLRHSTIERILSMILTDEGLKQKDLWERSGFLLPQYNRDEVISNTSKRPNWIHFGAGNLFRAFQANAVHGALNRRQMNKGIIVAEGFDYEIIDKIYTPHDNLSVLATLKSDGSVEKTVVGAVTEALKADPDCTKDFTRLYEIFRNPSLQLASFTITEKGYSLVNASGYFTPAVEADFVAGPKKAVTYMGKITALLYNRYSWGELPLAMVSMDNCSHNGDKLYAAIHTFAEKWVNNRLVDSGFLEYVENPRKVSFPWTMIDKITPRPDASVEQILKAYGLEDTKPVQTGKNTYIAPFVNAEECEYLVIEDQFPNGRPHLEDCGFLFTDRETVDKVEKMKVCTCLNPLHTALAVFGCLLGFQKISDEMKDEDLLKMVKWIGYREGLPVVVNPGIIEPKEFIDAVINVRVPNPFMPDTPQRIATDTSQKLAIRFGETVKAYAASDTHSVEDLKLIPLVYAGWIRYLLALDNFGREFTLSPDPLLATVTPYVEPLKKKFLADSIRTGITEGEVEDAVGGLLRMDSIFGVNLYEAGMADLVLEYLTAMLSGKGAVRQTLKNTLAKLN